LLKKNIYIMWCLVFFLLHIMWCLFFGGAFTTSLIWFEGQLWHQMIIALCSRVFMSLAQLLRISHLYAEVGIQTRMPHLSTWWLPN
jgi:hypothetical protein